MRTIFQLLYVAFIFAIFATAVIALIEIVATRVENHIHTQNIEEDPSDHYMKTTNNRSLHQCVFPIYYGINYDVSPDIWTDIHDAFEYWNWEADKKLFKFIGFLDVNIDNPISYGQGIGPIDTDGGNPINFGQGISIVYERCENRGATLARIDLGLFVRDGCMSSSNIALYPRALGTSHTDLISVIRHEIGHLLGLAHNPEQNALMYKWAFLGKEWLDEMIEVERRAFKVYY
jgi:hypothetical protein